MTRTHLPDPGTYSWWSYRPGQFEANRGLRIDLVLCSLDLAPQVRAVVIDLAERADDDLEEKPSDHAPVIVDLRNIYQPDEMRAKGFAYASIGRA